MASVLMSKEKSPPRVTYVFDGPEERYEYSKPWKLANNTFRKDAAGFGHGDGENAENHDDMS